MDRSHEFADNLLWGLIAERRGFVSNGQLRFAVDAWAFRRSESLATVLAGTGALDGPGLQAARKAVDAALAEAGRGPEAAGLREAAGRLVEGVDDPEWQALLRVALAGVALEDVGTMIEDEPATDEPDNRHVDAFATVVPDSPGTVDLSDKTMARPRTDPGGEPTIRATMGDMGATEGPAIHVDPFATYAGADPYATITDDSPPPSPGGRATAPAPPSVHRYKVVRELARGGLGEVFVAHDTELRREVALKEIQGRYADRVETRSRFLLEAEVTGGLEHPGIVPVYGLGQYEDGRPYYAMRFISGESLQEALDTFHAGDIPDRDPGERALAVRRLLGQIVDVCEAIGYAHSRGVLHRDLKPGNVMIGRFGETLVVDWGLAKPLGRCFQDDPGLRSSVKSRSQSKGSRSGSLTRPATNLAETAILVPEPSTVDLAPTEAIPGTRALMPSSMGMRSETLAGSTMGTPQYMSPEQARGEIDQLGPASDIYSLGATLYCVLTGKAPFLDPKLMELLTKVREGRFPRPTEANPTVPKPLEAIVLKAMALDPGARYPSAMALAEDIEHWLADEPVTAYRDPWRTRARRWVRRHKTAVTAAAVLAVTGLTAMGVGTALIERERRLVSANFALAYDAADTMLSEVADVDLADIPQMEPVRRRLLEMARVKFADLLRQQSLNPAVQLLEGRTRARLGNVLDLTGDYAAAEPTYRTAIASLSKLAADRPGDPGPRVALARAEHGLGVLLGKLNRFKEAESTLRDALRLRAEVADQSPNDAQARAAVAETRYQIGAILARLSGRKGEDELLYRQAIGDQEEVIRSNPTGPGTRERLVRYLNNLARLESKTRPAEAEARFRQILDLINALDKPTRDLPGPRWQAARASNNLGAVLLKDRERSVQAGPLFVAAKAGLESLAAEFPNISAYRRELAGVAFNLALMAQSKGRTEEAEADARQAVELLRKLAADEPQVPDHRRSLALALNSLTLLRAGKHPEEAEATLAESKAIQEDLIRRYPEVSEYPSGLGRSLYAYGMFLLDAGRPESAKARFVEAERWFRAAIGADPTNRLFIDNLFENTAQMMALAIQAHDAPTTAALASSLPELLPNDAKSYQTAAMGLALAAGEVAGDDTGRAEDYARRAVETLRTAIDRGLLTDPQALRVNELKPLRERKDFQDLMRGLLARGTPGVG